MNKKRSLLLLPMSRQILACSLVYCLIIASISLGQTQSASAQDRPYDAFTKERQEEIIHLVQQHALRQPSMQHFAVFRASTLGDQEDIRAFLQSFDAYAVYVDALDLRNAKESASLLSAGVGMDLVYDAQGNMICIPYADGVAYQAGLRYGDRLVGVDGQILPNDLQTASILIRGAPETAVHLRIARPDGSEALVLLHRAATTPPSVRLERDAKGSAVIRIYRFDHNTLAQLTQALEQYPLTPNPLEQAPLVLDLRGNVGGSVKAARECLRLFLPLAVLLEHTEDNTAQRKTVHAKALGSYAGRKIDIWQDALTASASELFIVAMVQARAARTLGQTSGGKARLQQNFILSDGSRLRLTTQRLLFADGSDWQGTGIKPHIFVEDPHFLKHTSSGKAVW